MTTHINDGGTWRNLNGIYINDGGTWRTIQSVHVNDGGTWRQVYINNFSTSLAASSADDGFLFSYVGFSNGATAEVPLSFGSLTPTGAAALPGGITLAALADEYGTGFSGYNRSFFITTGHGSDPGQSYFVSIDIESDTGAKNYTSASASSYVYSAGQATWQWTTEIDMNGIADPHDIIINF
jgi:hypothetical protein